MDEQKQSYIYATAAVLIWSTVASAFKIALRYMSFLQLLLYASIVSIVTLFVILVVQRKLTLLKRYSRGDYMRSIGLGILNPFLYYIVLFKAYSVLPAQQAMTLNYTWPIMLVLLSIPLLRQRITCKRIVAICISFVGVWMIATQGNILRFRFTNPIGVGLALSSALIWALFWIYNVRDKRDDVVKLFLNFGFGFVFILVVNLIFSDVTVPNTMGFIGATYVGLFEMGVTFVIWLKALKLSQTTAQVSNLIYMVPFLSLVVIHFVVGERISLYTVGGLTLIITGIIIQQRPDFKSRNKVGNIK